MGMLAERIKNCFLLLGSIFFDSGVSHPLSAISPVHTGLSAFTSHRLVLSFSFSLSLFHNDSLPCIWPVDILETQGLCGEKVTN